MKYTWKIRQIIEDNISLAVYDSSPIKIPWMGQANQIHSPLYFLGTYVLFQRKAVGSTVSGLKQERILSVTHSTMVTPAQPLSASPNLCALTPTFTLPSHLYSLLQ